MSRVWVELNDAGLPVRIFRNQKSAHAFGSEWVAQWDRAIAVEFIRRQLWLRCLGECELCGSVVTEFSGHMHEKKWRGKGGEISLENSVFICPRTHDLEHKSRNPRFSKKGVPSLEKI